MHNACSLLFAPRRRPLAIALGAVLSVVVPSSMAQQSALPDITVTGTREGQRLERTPASIGIIAVRFRNASL
jgi:hypothetical protein